MRPSTIFNPAAAFLFFTWAVLAQADEARSMPRDEPPPGSLEATVGPRFFIDLAVETSGVVEDYLVQEGEAVAAGQSVLRLKREGESSRLELARSRLSEAETVIEYRRRVYERKKEMRDDKVVSEQEYEKDLLELRLAEARKVQAEAELDIASFEYERKEVTAPVSGLWFRSLKQPGESIREFEPIGMLTDPSQLEATFYCPPEWIGAFAPGDEITLLARDWKADGWTPAAASVVHVDTMMDPAILRFRLRVSLDPDQVRSGQSVNLPPPPDPSGKNAKR